MASQTFGILRFQNGEKEDEILHAADLAELLRDGAVTRLKDGLYRFNNEPGHPRARIFCCECENNGIPKERSRFRTISQRGYSDYYYDRLAHKHLDDNSPCQNPDREPIRDVRVEPIIRLSEGSQHRCSLLNSIRRHSLIETQQNWEEMLLDLEQERDAQRVESDDSSALFKWDKRYPKNIRSYGSENFRIRPFEPDEYVIWKYSDSRESLAKIPSPNNTFQVPRDGSIFIGYPNCDCDKKDPGKFCGCKHEGDNELRPINFEGLSFPLIQFKDVNEPVKRAKFERVLKDLHGSKFVPHFPDSSSWITWDPDNARNIDGVITTDDEAAELLVQIRTRENKKATFNLVHFDSIQDEFSRDLVKIDINDSDDRKVYSEFKKPVSQSIDKKAGEEYYAIRISGSGIFSVEIDGRVLASYKIVTEERGGNEITILSGDERQDVLKRSMEFDFASVSDSYYDGDFIKKVWDFLRASQTESRELVSEDDPFATNRTSLRLNKLRKLIPEMQHIDHTTDDEDDYAPEPSSSIFHRLMELNRPGRGNSEEVESALEKNPVFGGWVSPSERVVGSEEMEWGLLFNSEPVKYLVDRGATSSDLRLLKNGLRMIKTESALQLEIPISDRLPAMDFVSEDPASFLSSLFHDLSDEEAEKSNDTYSRLRDSQSSQTEHIFCGMTGSMNQEGSKNLGIWSTSLKEKPRPSRWWEEDQALSIDASGGGLTLHRFSTFDDVDEQWSYQFYLVKTEGDNRLAMKIFTSLAFLGEGCLQTGSATSQVLPRQSGT